MSNVAELERALDSPWEKWTFFLHPEQRELVERKFAGPAKVSGSAGMACDDEVIPLQERSGSNRSARIRI